MSLLVGSHHLENGKDPYIIAEIGSNWKDIDDCIKSITAAKEAGANAVKFQMFDYASFYGFPKGKSASWDTSAELSDEWLPKLKQQADRCGIDFMCTVFNPLHVRAIDQYVAAHKVASSDINHVSLLKEIAKMGKPVFLSCGAASHTEIELALGLLDAVPVILMYCVSAYPAQFVDLTLIDSLKSLSSFVGYSDHTLDSAYIPYAAVKLHGAVALEKHMTAINQPTQDSGHSLDFAKFKSMVERIRGKSRAVLGRAPQEEAMRLRHKRRLVIISDVKQGEVFRFGKNFGIFRSTKIDTDGLPAMCYLDVDGRKAKADFDMGRPLTKDDFE